MKKWLMIYGLRLRVAGAIFPQVKHTDKGNGKYVALITILSVCCGRSGGKQAQTKHVWHDQGNILLNFLPILSKCLTEYF